jgi:hypothetical protein
MLGFSTLAAVRSDGVVHAAMVQTNSVSSLASNLHRPGASAYTAQTDSTMSPPPKRSSGPKTRANLALRLEDDAPEASAPAALEDDSLVEEPVPDAEEDLGEQPLTRAQREGLRRDLQERLGAYLTRGRPRIVLTDNVHTMVSIKRGDGVVTFRLHHMFLRAPSLIVRELARYAEQQDRGAAKLLRDYIDANEDLVRQRTDPRPISVDVEGKHHNLQDIFDALNERYFEGTIEARITWGPRSRRKRSRESIKLGSYTFEDELIRIHPVLDAADVPRFFVEWIVYHEMLHEIHDMPVVDGRRVYHTSEFRRAEAQFEHYAEAVLWERTQLHKLLER